VPITIGSNIASLAAQRLLGQNATAQADVFSRLSSGLRITKASDDAAGLAIASSLNSDGRVYSSALRNLNDGISALAITDGALQQESLILTRLKELATQAANGVYSATQRTALDTEAQALAKEYSRILSVTKFNGQNLLDGSVTQLTLQAGYGATEQLVVPVSTFPGSGGTTTTTTTTVGTGTFQASVSYSNGFTANPALLSSIDLNGDGKLDIISGDSGTGKVSVFLGNGDGTFKAPASYGGGGDDYALALADINGDGKLDVVTANGSPTNNSVDVMLGNGDGTFKAITSFVTGGSPYSIVLADFNGDGKLDAVTGDKTGNSISLLLGNGDGTFKSRTSFTTGTTPRGVYVGDLNGDGNLDVIAGTSSGGSGEVDVFLGNGDGTFHARTTLPLSVSGTQYPTIADLNGDGKLDIAAGGDNNSGRVEVWLGNGDGTFKAKTTYTEGNQPEQIVALDVNGDGKPDLLVSEFTGNSLDVYIGNGDGTFNAKTSYAAGSGTWGITYGDLNGDGVKDVGVANQTANTISVFIANTTSTTTTSTSAASSFTLPTFDLLTQSDARSALDTFTTTLNQVESALGTIGSWQSRIQVALSNLSSVVTQDKAAESRIVDADVAQETADLTRRNILQQEGAAVLAQANQTPALALSLLR
jgi:flagellin-like hook-associated protein FlgL